jgi:hypothetical protein
MRAGSLRLETLVCSPGTVRCSGHLFLVRGPRVAACSGACLVRGMRPSILRAVTPSSSPISSVISPFPTLSTVVSVKRIVLPELAGSDAMGMSSKAAASTQGESPGGQLVDDRRVVVGAPELGAPAPTTALFSSMDTRYLTCWMVDHFGEVGPFRPSRWSEWRPSRRAGCEPLEAGDRPR